MKPKAKQHVAAKIQNQSASDAIMTVNLFAETVHDYWIDLNGRETWIHGHYDATENDNLPEPGVEYKMSTKVIKNLHMLRQSNPTAPVTIHMQTCGGYITDGLAIYDAIKAMPYKTKIISYTHARSMSSIILQAANERILMPNSYFMFHRGYNYVGGNTLEVYSNIEWAKKYDEKLMNIYIDALKKGNKFKMRSRASLKAMLEDCMDKKSDYFLTAEEAVEWGFADKILDKF